MALDGLNAAAAAAILNDADPDTRTQGVVVSALVPGVLGIAVPLVLAQQEGLVGGAAPRPAPVARRGPSPVVVPNVVGMTQVAAGTSITGDRLEMRVLEAASNEVAKGQVVDQDPPASRVVREGTTVTITVSSGPPEPGDEPADIDADLTAKLKKMEADLVGKIDASATAMNAKLDAITAAISKLQPPAAQEKRGSG